MKSDKHMVRERKIFSAIHNAILKVNLNKKTPSLKEFPIASTRQPIINK